MTKQLRQKSSLHQQGSWSSWLGGVLVALCLFGYAHSAEACSCLPPTVESSYNRHSDVATVTVLSESTSSGQRIYVARVLRVFKGCLEVGARVRLTTPDNGAACGVTLPLLTPVLINGTQVSASSSAVPTLAIGLCDYNVPALSLTAEDRAFLSGRTVCCKDECHCADGSEPVSCLVDPCSVAAACEDGTCEANYCGGCNAEFYDDAGYAVCEGPQCDDLSGVDFGLCKAILGYGVVDGSCQAISGCSAGDYKLFDSLEACYESCATGCYSDAECAAGERCNAGELCLSPPGCTDGNPCPAVCYGYCEPAPEEAECETDEDCMRSGCNSEVCAAEPVFTTCDVQPEYACFRDDAITQCGCQAGSCGFSQTEELAACLESVGAE